MHKRRPQITDGLLNIHETAGLLGRSPSTIYAWTERGLMPAPVKFGGSYRWRLNDLMEWADSGFPKRVANDTNTKVTTK